MPTVRALNRSGVNRFDAYLKRLRRGAVEPPPSALLHDTSTTEALPEEIDIEAPPRSFRNRFTLAEYLCERLAPIEPEVLDQHVGLWAWLSLFWFDRVCPAREDGSRRPGRDYRHIPDLGFRNRHRHLLLGPYHVYRRHKALSLVLLTGPAHAESGMYHEIAGRRDLIANRGVVESALILYMDRRTGALKRGAQARDSAPGTVRRFVRVLQQLDLTYDIYGLSGRDLVQLLPQEFDAFRTAQRSRRRRAAVSDLTL